MSTEDIFEEMLKRIERGFGGYYESEWLRQYVTNLKAIIREQQNKIRELQDNPEIMEWLLKSGE